MRARIEETLFVAHGPFLTVDDVRKDLRLSKSQIYRLLAAGEIESIKIGRSRRIPADAIERFIDRHLAGEAA